MKITAIDSKGNEFQKSVSAINNQYGLIISFGWPTEYYLSYLLMMYPFESKFVIDMDGRNHKGYPVFITAEQMNKVVEEYKEKDNSF